VVAAGRTDSAQPFEPARSELYYELPDYGVRLHFRPTDFTQVNHAVNRLLVARAIELLDPQPGERIADLFCGLGNFSLPLARRGAQVIGFEGSSELVARARTNAAANGSSPSSSKWISSRRISRPSAASTSCWSIRRARARSKS